MTQSEGNPVTPVKADCTKNATESPTSLLAQPDDEDIPDENPVIFFEWVDQHVQIFLDRWQALEEVGNVENPPFERPHSVAAFHQRMLELFSNDIPGAFLGQGGGLIRCATSMPFLLVIWKMARFESNQCVRAILGQEGLPGKLAHVSISTSVNNAQYPPLDGVLF